MFLGFFCFILVTTHITWTPPVKSLWATEENREPNGGQEEETESQSVAPPASATAHQPPQALCPSGQQERYVLSGSSPATLP